MIIKILHEKKSLRYTAKSVLRKKLGTKIDVKEIRPGN